MEKTVNNIIENVDNQENAQVTAAVEKAAPEKTKKATSLV